MLIERVARLIKAYSDDEEVKTIKTEFYNDQSGRVFEIEYLNFGRVGINRWRSKGKDRTKRLSTTHKS